MRTLGQRSWRNLKHWQQEQQQQQQAAVRSGRQQQHSKRPQQQASECLTEEFTSEWVAMPDA